MGYKKIIRYANVVELYEYTNDIRDSRRGLQGNNGSKSLDSRRASRIRSGKQRQSVKTENNARRSALAFRRIVSANLGESENPLLITLTYAENITDIKQGHKDFNTFARNVRNSFGQNIRYIAVPEFQKRGAVHFHALFWGVPSKELASTERSTRLVAKLWGLGYVDLHCTDGDMKLSSYLAKYMAKTFMDERLGFSKAYVCSRNIIRPEEFKDPIILPYFWGGLNDFPDLNEAEIIIDKEYDTKWLGTGRHRIFKIKND